MTVDTIKATDEIVSCSDNGQHPLVYINLKGGKGKCQYCGQSFELTKATPAHSH
ncbi:MAG: zinc-finger domain-containing protein [Mariprofundaceae bacterium]|nr:zinc-finger domain-containing protein [Mariprofundaceae bacterium]